MAAGWLAAADSAGIRVPEDLSITGFDDSSIATVVWPPLTALRQPVSHMAAAAVDALVQSSDGALPAETRIVAHRIVERGTTAS